MLSACGILILLPFATGDFHQSGSALTSNISSISSGHGISRFLRDGEFERVTTWPGFCAKETSVDWGEIAVTLREVWLKEEKRKLQLIYEGGTLSDCFDEKIEPAGYDVSGDYVTGECSSQLNLLGLRKNGADDEVDKTRTGILSHEKVPPRDIADWFISVEALRDQCYRVRTRTRNQVLARQEKSRVRVRRGILTDFLFAPGTKWCGPKQLASSYNELGAFDQLDRCCRRHDHCQRAIPPMTQRYALYNHLPFTLSHCGCDQSFRTCLKMAGTSSANFVGKLFFNVVQTKCFVLKPQKICVRRSWWGKCELHEYRKQAHLRDNVPY